MIDPDRAVNPPDEPGQKPSPNQAVAEQPQNAQPNPSGEMTSPHDKLTRWLVPTFVVSLAVLLVLVYVNNWNWFDGTRSIEVTDDAYVRADVTPLSTKVAGVVTKVPVTDFQRVKAGDLIAQLRNDDFQSRVDEALAAKKETEAAINPLRREEEVQDARIASAQSSLSVGKTNIGEASNDVQSARSFITVSEASIGQAQAELQAVEASIRFDQANAERALLEKNRQHALYADRATTKRAVEEIDANYAEASAAIARDTARKQALLETLAGRKAELRRAKDQLANSVDSKSNAKDQFAKLNSDLLAQLKQREVLTARESVFAAELNRKEAALKDAQVALDYTYIRAPADGTISERKVFPGQLVSAGTQAATLVSATPWVVASYRETQLSHVFVGNKAEVTVDGLPGRTFKGIVNTISPASEAQFALLPPDNASGNFTKITQRIPVKITFEAGQPDMDRLRPGMSVITHVWTKAHP